MERVLAHFDTDGTRSLINSRLAYVAVSRASDDVRIYTNDAKSLGDRLATDISKTAAVDFRPPSGTTEVQKAVAAFRANDPTGGLASLQRDGRVHEYANPEHRLAAVALDYAARDDRAVIIAPDPAERRELTQLVRDELRQQGRLAAESRAILVLVEQHFGNPRLAANYEPGDQIRYKTGSPMEHGIADNTTATVLSVDRHANTLAIATRDGNEVAYNPALLKRQTGQSRVYREQLREISVGERILFTAPAADAHVRAGAFATVEQIGEDSSLSVRLDTGKSIELDRDRARHIDYGYTVEAATDAGIDRVLVTGEPILLAQQQESLTRLSAQTRDLGLYTSDSSALAGEIAVPTAEIALAQNAGGPTANSVPQPVVPAIELEGFGIGL